MDPATGYRKVLLNFGLTFQIRGLQLDPLNRYVSWCEGVKGIPVAFGVPQFGQHPSNLI